MPRFHFHIRDDINAHDEEGREFTRFEQAVTLSTYEARDLAAQNLRAGHLDLDHDIAAENRGVMLTVRFREIVTIKG